MAYISETNMLQLLLMKNMNQTQSLKLNGFLIKQNKKKKKEKHLKKKFN
jgi:hypothetical protein